MGRNWQTVKDESGFQQYHIVDIFYKECNYSNGSII